MEAFNSQALSINYLSIAKSARKINSPGARRVQGSWKAKEISLIVPYYTHIRGHENESLPGT